MAPPHAYDLPGLLPGAQVVSLVRVPSLYVIRRGSVIEYVGKTRNWLQRMERHQRGVVGPPGLTPEKMLDVIIVPCRRSLGLRERALIAWLEPEQVEPIEYNARMRRVIESWVR